MVTPEDSTLHVTTTVGDATTEVTGGAVKYVVRVAATNKVGTAIKQNDATGNAGVQLNGHTLELGEQLYQGDLVKRDTNAIADEFARPGTEWRYKGEKIGVYNDQPDATYTKQVKVGQIYKDLGLNRTIPASRVSVYVDGVENASQTAKAIKSGDEDNKYGSNGILTQVFYDQDTDSVIITEINTWTGEIVRNVAASGTRDAYVVVSSETQSSERPTGVSGNLEYVTDETFDVDARVLYTYSLATEDVMSVKVAESVEGTVTRAENTNTNDFDRKALTIDGQRYAASANSAGEKLGDVTVNSDYVVYLDTYGYLIYVEESDVAINNYALLITTASTSSFIGNRARLLFTDGTIKNVETEKNYNAGTNAIDDYTIVTCRVDEDGVYTLKEVAETKSFRNVASHTGAANGALAPANYAHSATAGTAFSMKSDKAGVTVSDSAAPYGGSGSAAGVYNANSATVFVVADAGTDGSGSDFTAYTGIKSAPTIANTNLDDTAHGVAAYWFCKNGTMLTVMFVFPGSGLEVEDTSNRLLYIAKASVGNLIHDKDGDYYVYNAIVGSEIQTIKVDAEVKVDGAVLTDGDSDTDTSADTKLLLGTPANRLFKSYTMDKYGVITSLKTYPAYVDGDTPEQVLTGTGIDKTSADYTVILGKGLSKKTITVDENAKIYYVDKDGNITESSYRGISVDDDDQFAATVKDFLVKNLVIQQVSTVNAASAIDVDITADPVSPIVGKPVTLTAEPDLGRYDELDSYAWYKSNSAMAMTTEADLNAIENLPGGKIGTRKTLTVTPDNTTSVYYYCIVKTTNERAAGVARSVEEYVLTASPDPANQLHVIVTYTYKNRPVGQATIDVTLVNGIGSLTEAMVKAKLPAAYADYDLLGWFDKSVNNSNNTFTVELVKAVDTTPEVPTEYAGNTSDKVTIEVDNSGEQPQINLKSETGATGLKKAEAGDAKTAQENALKAFANEQNKEFDTFEALYDLETGKWNIVPVTIGDETFMLVIGERKSVSTHPWGTAVGHDAAKHPALREGCVIDNSKGIVLRREDGCVVFLSQWACVVDGVTYIIDANNVSFVPAE